MKIRLKFSKTGAMKFIGHLDLMRMFQKIFRQANIPIAYSEGFNPHQIFSIAAPLPVGITSEGEYMDIKLFNDINPNFLIEEINVVCPKGISILSAVILDNDEPAAMSLVSAAKYVITQADPIITNQHIDNFVKQDIITILKKSKKGIINEVNIKPGIFNLVVNENKIIMTISTGSVFNIKPEAVLESLHKFNDIEYNPFNFKIHRMELYHGDTMLLPLLEKKQ